MNERPKEGIRSPPHRWTLVAEDHDSADNWWDLYLCLDCGRLKWEPR